VELVMDHPRIELFASLGFAVCFGAAFLIMALLPEGRFTGEQIEALWILAMSFGYINHGVWHRERETIISGTLGIATVVSTLMLAPTLVSSGWLVLGIALAVTGIYNIPRTHGHSTTHAHLGAFVALGGLIRLLSVYVPSATGATLMAWTVLVGLVFITLGRDLQNPAWHYMGVAWIVASVVSYALRPDLLFLSVGLVFVVGMIANFVSLYRLLGRTPKIGELISFATRALFLKGLKKPIDQYSVLTILLKGNIAAEHAIGDLLSRLEPTSAPILLLGPTAPTQVARAGAVRTAWVTSVSGVSKLDYPLLTPEDPTAVSVFLSKVLAQIPEGTKPVIIGDFLDNMIPHMDESQFYKYYSDLASTARVANHTIVFIVNADIHSEEEISVVKRFADVIIENREREEGGRLIREVRVSNRVDNIHRDWERY
jgi:hypothetical protein